VKRRAVRVAGRDPAREVDPLALFQLDDDPRVQQVTTPKTGQQWAMERHFYNELKLPAATCYWVATALRSLSSLEEPPVRKLLILGPAFIAAGCMGSDGPVTAAPTPIAGASAASVPFGPVNDSIDSAQRALAKAEYEALARLLKDLAEKQGQVELAVASLEEERAALEADKARLKAEKAEIEQQKELIGMGFYTAIAAFAGSIFLWIAGLPLRRLDAKVRRLEIEERELRLAELRNSVPNAKAHVTKP
jgi:hypothetical protein